jgi:hypothetical protein
MTNYVTLPFNKKLNLLREHCFDDGDWPDLDHEKWCLHCGKSFTGHAARVWQDEARTLWLECGTPGCSGSPIDWAEFPWWDDRHPLTRQQRRARKKPKPGGKSKRGNTDDDDIPF